jgi:hypothetical protein
MPTVTGAVDVKPRPAEILYDFLLAADLPDLADAVWDCAGEQLRVIADRAAPVPLDGRCPQCAYRVTDGPDDVQVVIGYRLRTTTWTHYEGVCAGHVADALRQLRACTAGILAGQPWVEIPVPREVLARILEVAAAQAGAAA